MDLAHVLEWSRIPQCLCWRIHAKLKFVNTIIDPHNSLLENLQMYVSA